MARKRFATPEEFELAFTEALQRICDLLLSRRGPEAMKKQLLRLEEQYQLLANLLAIRKSMPRRKLRALLVPDTNRIRAESQQARINVEDLQNLVKPLTDVAVILEGKATQLTNLPDLLGTLSRLTQPAMPKVQRFKPAFENAFRIQDEAQRSGNVVHANELARTLTRYEFKRNPESATRAMQRGISRVREEHRRCLKEGLDSPFISPEHQNSRLERSRT
jgi:hypothetical protein